MKQILLLGIALVVAAASPFTAVAQPLPSPVYSDAGPLDAINGVVLAPIPTATAIARPIINIRDGNDIPISGSTVLITITSSTNTLCNATVLMGVTGPGGDVQFDLGGGGCSHLIAGAAKIEATQSGGGGIPVTIRLFDNVKSPDFDGAGPNKSVGLPDLINFSAAFLGSGPQQCHDYDNNGNVGIEDLVIFAPAFITGGSCP